MSLTAECLIASYKTQSINLTMWTLSLIHIFLENSRAFDQNSTVLGPPLKPEDVVRERTVRSFKVRQLSLFDENDPDR